MSSSYWPLIHTVEGSYDKELPVSDVLLAKQDRSIRQIFKVESCTWNINFRAKLTVGRYYSLPRTGKSWIAKMIATSAGAMGCVWGL